MPNMRTVSEAILNLLNREPYSSESLVIPNHTRQMVQWMVRQGIEFVCTQDTPDAIRQKFVNRLWEDNDLDVFLEGIATLFVLTGGVLWYLSPTPVGYQILWFHSGEENGAIDGVPSQYRVYYEPGGKTMQEAIFRYSYEDYSQNMFYSYGNAMPTRTRWVRMRIRPQVILQEFFQSCPSLDPYSTNMQMEQPLNSFEYQNTLGFIPCVEAANTPYQKGDLGRSDFQQIATQVEVEQEVRSAITNNIYTFGNPSLITSRPSKEVLQSYNRLSQTGVDELNSFAAANRFRVSPAMGTPQPRRYSGKSWGQTMRERIPSVIGNVEPDEKFGYINPDPVSPDQALFANGLRASLHSALGGIDPQDVSFSTFGEVKSLFGRVAATAKIKTKSLWTKGLGTILKMAIYAEERLYAASFKAMVAQIDPKVKIDQITDEHITTLIYEQGFKPPTQMPGLCPYGAINLTWRYNGQVFEDSPQDKLDKTIYVRNLQELGVGSLEAIDEVFPDLSDEEKRRKLSGIPFRTGQAYLQLIQQMMQIQQGLYQMPDPMDPNMPLGARLSVIPLVERVINTLNREFSYGAVYDNADPAQAYLPNASAINFSGLQPAGSAISGTAFGTPGISTDSSGSPIPYDWANPPVLPHTTIRLPGSSNSGGMAQFDGGSGYAPNPLLAYPTRPNTGVPVYDTTIFPTDSGISSGGRPQRTQRTRQPR